MALDRVLHGNERPRTEIEMIRDLYRAGRLEIGQALGMLWIKGLCTRKGYELLEGKSP